MREIAEGINALAMTYLPPLVIARRAEPDEAIPSMRNV